MISSDLEDKRVIAAAAFISALVVLYWQFMPVVIGSVAEARGYSESALGFLASAYAGGTIFNDFDRRILGAQV